MTVSLLHLFHSAQPDDPDATLIRPSNWNAQHALTGTPGAILGFDGSGNAISVTPSSGRITLLVDTTFYVATTGNDSTGDGSVGSPWLTLQHAANVVTQNYFVPSDLIETVGVTIQMADGTYPTTEITFLPTVIGLNVSPAIYGNLGDPTKVVLTCSADSYTVLCYGVWSLGYVTIANTNAPDSCNAIVGCDGFGTTFAAFLYLENVVLGNAGSASSGAAHQGYHFISNDGAAIEVQKLTITGTAKGLIFCKGEDSSVASFGFNHSTLTLSVDPLWTTGAIVLDRWGKVYWNPDGGVTGTSSGPQYQVLGSGILLIGAFLSETSIPGVTTGNNNGGFIIPTQGTQFSFGTKTGLTLGSTVAPTLTGAVNFVGKTSGTITLSAQDAAGTWTMKLPTTAGTNGYSLTTDGSGNTSWASVSGGGGTPSTPLNSVQYDNAGAFGGAANFFINSGNPDVSAGSAHAYLYNALPIAYQTPGPGGDINTFLGGAGNFTTSGQGNFGEGPNCLTAVTTGQRNMGMGANVLTTCTSGQDNAAMGEHALHALTTGQNNLAVGQGALQALVSGSFNVALGGSALASETTGSNNIGIGSGAISSQNGTGGNIGIGQNAGNNLTSGFANLFIGTTAGTNITTGFANTIIGGGFGGSSSQSFSVMITNNSQLVFDYNYTSGGTNTFSLGGLNVPNGPIHSGISGTTGSFILTETGGNAVTIQPTASTGAWTFKLPTSAGTNLYVLQTDGAGNTSWVPQSGGGGGVTSGTMTANAAVYATGASAIASNASALTNGQILIGSTSATPVQATIATSGSGISVTNGAGTITLANTGATSIVAGTGISVSGATGAVTVSLSTPVTVANGGSGAGTFTAHGLLLGEGTSAFGVTAAGASNQILIGQGTSADPIWATTLPSAALPNYTGDVTSSGTVNTLVNIPTGTPAVGTILHTNIAAPSAPAAGKIAVYTNTTNNILSAMNSGGTVSNTVVPDTGASNNFLTAISASGVISKAQPSFANLSGSIASTQMPAYTGDVTSSAGATVNTLVNIPTGVTAAGRILFSNIAAPATPSAGTVQVYTDTTNLILSSKNSAGTVSNTVVPATAGANQFATAISAAGVISFAQPSVSNLSGLPVTVAQGGTGLATLPVHTLLIGAAASNVANTGTGTANQILISNGASVDPSWATTVPTGAMPAYTGDVTSAIGTTVNTLASVITAGGPIGSATVVPVITYDAKGRLTAVTTATIAAGTANVDPSPQRVVATTGGSTTMTGWNLVLDPAGALATYTVVLPASPTNGQIAVIRSSQPISSLSWTATPATAVAAPNTLAAGSRVEAIYISAVTSWYFGL